MAKDPAFLFYYQDFLVGTNFMGNASIGAYIKILCYQADRGHLSEQHIKNICGSKKIYEEIKPKFEADENGLFFNKRLEFEVIKRRKFTESRRRNRTNPHKDPTHIYLILNEGTNLIKIGTSINPKRRVIELGSFEHGGLRLLCCSEKTDPDREKEVHDAFDSCRIRGEWFQVDPNDVITHMRNHMSLQVDSFMITDMENRNENEDAYQEHVY